MFHKCFDLVFGILSLSKSFIGCSWIAPLTLAVMVMRGLTSQSVVLSICMSGLYLAFFPLCVVFGNLLWQ